MADETRAPRAFAVDIDALRIIQHRAEKVLAHVLLTPEPDPEIVTLLTFLATLIAVLATGAEDRQTSQGGPNASM